MVQGSVSKDEDVQTVVKPKSIFDKMHTSRFKPNDEDVNTDDASENNDVV